MDLGLTDRVYILTGASGGLGLATARELVADGAKVVISSRSQESIDRATAGWDRRRSVSRSTTPTPLRRLS
ncbi:SDR family NAD(P)-dependent oxidoreductase [Aeromicrobium sp. UC242_57]|uniref:SDR family NAD(P)-dependent oxidoreductase n=1 Tax=Aeromicrobium sp. UC242_57 TaxID=3374624 RepID=UPI0037931E48